MSAGRRCVLDLKAVTETLRGKIASRVTRKIQGFGDRRSEQGIAQGIQHDRKGAFGDVMLVVADRELRDQVPNGIEDRVQGVAIAGKDHPGGKRSGAFFPECVKALVNDHAGVGLTSARSFDSLGDAAVDGIRDRPRQLALKAGCGSEMMEKIGVRAADLRRDSLERHGLRATIDQQLARRGQGGGAAFFGGQAGSSY
jgi:hypothetical protein